MSQADEVVARAAQVVAQEAPRGGAVVADLTHEIVRGQFSEYVDGSLDSSDRARVERHLGECSACAAYLNTLRATVDLASQLPAKPAPSRTKSSILRRARAEL